MELAASRPPRRSGLGVGGAARRHTVPRRTRLPRASTPLDAVLDEPAADAGPCCPRRVRDLWSQIREEAREQSEAEPALASFLYSTILSHDRLERAVAFVLSNKLGDQTLLPTQLFELFCELLDGDCRIVEAVRADIVAVRERDPACQTYAQCLLNFKGFQAVQAHRLAHALATSGRLPLALALQSRVSQVFHVDIHPMARLGSGLLMDHATGIVIGETAVVGNNCSILHHVTLGGTGAANGDRHPKVGDNVLIGASTTILGNITIGEGAKIGAGSVVLAEIPAHATAVGVPARVIGIAADQEPATTMDHVKDVVDNWTDWSI